MKDLTSLWRLCSPPPSLFLPRLSLRSLQHFAERSEMREAAALHSSGLTENNSTGCPALRSMHRRSSDVSPPGTHTHPHTQAHTHTHTHCVHPLFLIPPTPTRPLLASFPRCFSSLAGWFTPCSSWNCFFYLFFLIKQSYMKNFICNILTKTSPIS